MNNLFYIRQNLSLFILGNFLAQLFQTSGGQTQIFARINLLLLKSGQSFSDRTDVAVLGLTQVCARSLLSCIPLGCHSSAGGGACNGGVLANCELVSLIWFPAACGLTAQLHCSFQKCTDQISHMYKLWRVANLSIALFSLSHHTRAVSYYALLL